MAALPVGFFDSYFQKEGLVCSSRVHARVHATSKGLLSCFAAIGRFRQVWTSERLQQRSTGTLPPIQYKVEPAGFQRTSSLDIEFAMACHSFCYLSSDRCCDVRPLGASTMSSARQRSLPCIGLSSISGNPKPFTEHEAVNFVYTLPTLANGRGTFILLPCVGIAPTR